MRWRSIVLGVLAITLGVAATVCIATQTRLYVAVSRIYDSSGADGLTPAQVAKAGALNAQSSVLWELASPLVEGSLLCVIALLIVLAWRWQARRMTEDD